MSSLQKKPTHVLIAINTIDVGVATFSLILNKMHKIENEQMSTPLPVHALNVPPTTPIGNCICVTILFCNYNERIKAPSISQTTD